MDIDLYYDFNRNYYTVHFANTKALSREIIFGLFSQYGNVVSINVGGDVRGLHFVKYKTLEEVRKCIEGFQKNDFIKLLPERSKLKNNKDKQNDQTDTKNGNSSNKNNHTDKKDNYKNKKDNQKNKKGNYTNKKKGNNQDGTNKDGQKERHGKRSSSLNGILSDNVSIDEKQINERMGYSTEQSGNEGPENNESFQASSRILNLSRLIDKFPMTNEAEFRKEFSPFSKNSCFDSPTHSEISFQKRNGKNYDEIPGLISMSGSTHGGSIKSLDQISSTASSKIEQRIILAQHVIVANVQKDFGVHYILHLFEKYNPIAISLMKTTSRTNIRYCHVYFKTPQQALEIEKRFDRFVLSGESLIVLRSHRLIEEFHEM